MKDNDEEFILLDVREKNEVDYANISPHINISIGEITEIFPAGTSASSSPTIW